MPTDTVISRIFAASDDIENGRTIETVLTHATTELGELAQEVIIEQGRSYKEPGADGVVGEALDLIACAADMIRQHAPDLTEDDLVRLIEPKLAKWQATA